MKQANRMGLLAACVMLCSPTFAKADDFTLGDVITDAKLYFTAPIRWDESDWMFFGGSVAVVAATHGFDGRVRDYFAPAGIAGVTSSDKYSLRDAIPAAAMVGGTWLISKFTSDSFANTEAYTMVEAAGFSAITAEALKYAAGRQRPDDTTDPNSWRAGGSSFPSLHVTAAFAVGTVFAESGDDDYRLLRRVAGYGMATATAYLRLHDNQHWLSDAVAGAALGIATGRFTTHRRLERARDWNLSVLPSESGGLELAFNYIVN